MVTIMSDISTNFFMIYQLLLWSRNLHCALNFCMQWDPKNQEHSVNQTTLMVAHNYKPSHLAEWDFGVDIIANTAGQL